MASNDEKTKPLQPRQADSSTNLENLGMDELLDLYTRPTLAEGEIVKGRVIKITPSDVVVDIGYKSEGLLPVNEVTGYDGQVRVKRGDEIEVFIERFEDSSGYVALSREKAARMRVWDDIEAAFKADQAISGRVIDRVKGGLQVDVGGIKAFLPGSLIDTKPVKNLDALRGHEMQFKIVSFDKKRSNVVLSRRAILEVEQAAAKKTTFGRLKEGELTHGVVKNITEYGVFVDLGGVDGLLHITDISWGRVAHPSEYFNVGDEIEVVVLKFDADSERVSLGYKQKSPDPWSDVADRYPLGSRVKGRVVSLTDYGAFVELEEGIDGLIHISDMSWHRRLKHPSEVLKKGDVVKARVINVDGENQRLSLSIREFLPNEWDNFAKIHNVGDEVVGQISKITDFGLFIRLADGVEGLAHVSEVQRDARQKLDKLFHPGDGIRSRIIKIDSTERKIGLTTRDVEPLSPEEQPHHDEGHEEPLEEPLEEHPKEHPEEPHEEPSKEHPEEPHDEPAPDSSEPQQS